MSKKRKNLVVTDNLNRKIEILTEISGATSEAEMFRRAVDLYMRLLRSQLSGGRVEIEDLTYGRTVERPLYDLYSVKKAPPEMLRQIGLAPDVVSKAEDRLSLA